MSSTGAGYDHSCAMYSPEGRVFQVEYAQKAVSTQGTAIGIRCRDGVVLAVEKPIVSKMLMPGSNRRVFGADSHAAVAITGYPADGRQIVNRAREEAKNYKDTYGHRIVPSVLSSRIASEVHVHTASWAYRPYGCAALIAGYDEDTKAHELYMVEPSGLCFRYFGCSAGKGAQMAKTEIEKIFGRVGGSEGISCREAVSEMSNILYAIRDTSKDKPFEVDMCWVCEETGWAYSLVPADLLAAADRESQLAQIGAGGEEKMES